MSDRTYNWKRFWCPRSGRINLADSGYLYDPEAEWGHLYNPDIVPFKTISNTPCLALLGEPGIGKTQVMELEQASIISKVCKKDEQVLVINLRSLSSEDRLFQKLFKSQEFTDWERGTHHLHIFLDSLDECLLRIDTVATLLVDEFKQYCSQIKRLSLRIACRTAVWPPVIEEELKQIWGRDTVGVYELAPLRRKDVREAATVEGIDPDAFLQEVQNKNIMPLAIKPVTLKFLLNTYRRNSGQFPANQRLHELYLDGCRCLCEETNESRLASKLKGKLNSEQRLIVAARIAAVTIFANRFAIWTGIDLGDVPNEDVLLRKLCQGSESVDGKEFEVTEEVIEEVLDTGLFSSRGLHRMGWGHQTYAEFLAAWYLVQHQTSLSRIMKLIVSSEDPDGKLVPQLHETAAWLASMKSDVLQEIMKINPDVLLRSDIPTDASVREAIVDNLLKQYEQEKLFYWDINNYQRYSQIAHPRLAEQLLPYIQDFSKQINAREAAIDIADVCGKSELQEDLANLALDSSQSIHLRVSAAKAVGSVGDTNTKLKLKPLAIRQLPEDEDDSLKGYCLSAVWSEHLTVQELFDAITPPKRRNYLGKYQIFLNGEVVPKLHPNDLVIALTWIENQGLRCFGYPFEELADAIILMAWEHFELPGVRERFTNIALIQWREYQMVITHNRELSNQFPSSLIEDAEKRHSLIEQVVIILLNSGEDPLFLQSSTTENLFAKGDIFWMLEKLQNTKYEKEQRIWTQMIGWIFQRNDAKEIDAIFTTMQNNNVLVLYEEFGCYFEPIELNSALAEKMKADYLKMQEWAGRRNNTPLLEPPPKERVLFLLEQLESGNLSAWWQLNMEMTLKPDSRHYDREFETDLTKLPGWQEADESTRTRIINGARKYIQEYEQVSYDWIGTNKYSRPDLAGCRAFQLLLKESPSFLNTILPYIWQRWAPIIIGFPCSNQREQYYLDLVNLAYSNAYKEVINTLMQLVDKENAKGDYISVISKFEKCWDERLKTVLLEKAKDKALKPKCMGYLLEELLKHKSIEAREFAKSLITFPLASAQDKRERTIVVCQILIENVDSSSWSFIWSLIQQDSAFGQEVIELVANRYSHGVHLNLTEKQIADLYIWLVHQYPYREDPDYSNDVIAHHVTTRECVANFRNSTLEQLKNIGTIQGCIEIQRIIQEFPELTWLKKSLLEAENIMRRKSWQPPQPEEVLQMSKQQNTMKTILVLASSPVNVARLRLDKEVREIDEGLRRSQKRDQFKLEQKWAVRAVDLRRALLDTQPQIVHFCGHGSGDEGLVIEDENGESKLVSTEALANLFKLCAGYVECVLLNACYSEIQANEIVQHIDYVIGMEKNIGDKAAIEFAIGFYDALGAGESIDISYEFGCSAIQLEGIPEHLTPKLKKKS